VSQAFLDALLSKQPYDITHRLLLPNGKIKYVHEKGMTSYGEDGSPLRTLGTIQDVTLSVEAALRIGAAEKSRLQSTLNALPLGIQESDLEGTITFCNHSFEQLLGYGKGELIGIKVWDLLPTDLDKAEIRDHLTQIIAQRPEPSPLIISNLRKDGEEIWLRIDWNYRWDANGELLGLSSLVSDISTQKRMEAALATTEFEWTEAINQAEQMLLILDEQSQVHRANAAFHSHFGLRHDRAVGRLLSDLRPLVTPNTRSLMAQIEALENSTDKQTYMTEDSSVYELQRKPLTNETTGHRGVLVTLTDISDIHHMNQRLELFGAVFENTAEGIMITDPNKRIIEINEAFRTITGYSASEVVGKTPTLLSSGRHPLSFYKTMWRTIRDTGRWSGEIWNRKKSGAIYPELLTVNALTGEDGEVSHYVGIFSDITRLKNSQEKLKHLTHYDALTDLPNRALLVERIEQAIRHCNRTSARMALVMLDLDRFKHINESYGHTIGDKLITDVANNLRQVVRGDDTLARIGGDEFVLLFEEIEDVTKLGFMTERIQRALAAPIDLPDQVVNMTASMGICVYPDDGANASELIRNADAAMFHAKAQGRNTYQFYTEELTRKAFEVLLMENDLRQAIERNELALYYQPQIDMRSGMITGAEALIRWHHTALGTISPARFIPIAEESGLIVELGDWVMHEGCRQLSTWINRGIALQQLAINVAALQLKRGGLVARLGELMREYAIESDQIVLEVTEGFVMDRTERSISQLNALCDLGVTLAIDDFGTGYSSLSYLKNLPMDKLKIDQSFVRGVPIDRSDVALTKTIIELATGLGMEVIAEGVETQEQAEFILSQGCIYAQGYYFGKPMPAREFEAFYRESINAQGSA